MASDWTNGATEKVATSFAAFFCCRMLSLTNKMNTPLTTEKPKRYRCKSTLLVVLAGCMILAATIRGWHAFNAIQAGQPEPLLNLPLAVLVPAMVFTYLITRRGFASQEGALMQLGCLIQLFLIVALPPAALHLALGFPVVFLAVELFETRLPAHLRDPLRARLLA